MSVVVLICLVLAFYVFKFNSETIVQRCPYSWALYTLDEMCIKGFEYYRTFNSSRDLCQRFGGDLVQFQSRSKMMFLDGVRKVSTYPYRVGMRDLNNDTTYQFLNGTQASLSNNQLHPFHGQVDKSVFPELYLSRRIHRDYLCTQLGYRYNGLETNNCDVESKFICEVRLGTRIATRAFGPSCTMDNCMCSRDDWIPIGHLSKLIKINTGLSDFETSRDICERIGGQLLLIPDFSLKTFLDDMFLWDDDRFFWLGLTRADDNITWYWSNGTEMLALNGTCGAFRINHYRWVAQDCAWKRHSLCEATNPCVPEIVMSANKTRITSNTTLTVTKATRLRFECSTVGYPQMIKSVTLTCWLDVVRSRRWRPHVDMSVHFDPEMHGKTCACWLSFYDATRVDPINVYISFKTPPLFVDEQNARVPMFTLVEGLGMMIDVEIYANPEPQIHNFTKKGPSLSVDLKHFNVSISGSENSILYTVWILANNFTLIESGLYKLTIGNDMEGKLQYRFFLNKYAEINQPPGRAESLRVWLIAVFVAVCMVSISLTIGYPPGELIDGDVIEEPEYGEDDVLHMTGDFRSGDSNHPTKGRPTTNVDDRTREYEGITIETNARMTDLDTAQEYAQMGLHPTSTNV